MRSRWLLILASLLVTYGTETVRAEDYSGVDLTHTQEQGFETHTKWTGSSTLFFVYNNGATIVVETPQGLAAPSQTYVEDGSDLVLNMNPAPLTHFECTPYPNKKVNPPNGGCDLDCSGCHCEECTMASGAVEFGRKTFGPIGD